MWIFCNVPDVPNHVTCNMIYLASGHILSLISHPVIYVTTCYKCHILSHISYHVTLYCIYYLMSHIRYISRHISHPVTACYMCHILSHILHHITLYCIYYLMSHAVHVTSVDIYHESHRAYFSM